MAVSPEYMKEQLKKWNPSWNPDTIDSWNGSKLESVYIKERKDVYNEIELKYGIKDYRKLD